MRDLLRPAATLLALATLGLGIALPLAATGLATALAPHRAGGSLLAAGGHTIGSELVGQAFTSPRYFHPRPSATTEPDPAGGTRDRPYNAAASAASNLGPSSATLLATLRTRAAALGPGAIPADAATASASGLDPHISPANAARQIPRIAAARALPPADIAALVERLTEGRELGLLGEPRVNVLRLNLALDGK